MAGVVRDPAHLPRYGDCPTSNPPRNAQTNQTTDTTIAGQVTISDRRRGPRKQASVSGDTAMAKGKHATKTKFAFVDGVDAAEGADDMRLRKQAEEALLRPGPCKAPFSTAPTSRASSRTRRASFRSSTSALSAMAFLKLDNIDVRLHSASRGAGSCFHPPPHPESRIARAPKAPASSVLRQRDGGGTTGRIPSSTMGITHQRIGLTLKGISSNHTLKRETMASFNRLLRARDSPPICCCFFDHHDIQYDL